MVVWLPNFDSKNGFTFRERTASRPHRDNCAKPLLPTCPVSVPCCGSQWTPICFSCPNVISPEALFSASKTPGAPNSPKQVIFMYFGHPSRYYLPAWSPGKQNSCFNKLVPIMTPEPMFVYKHDYYGQERRRKCATALPANACLPQVAFQLSWKKWMPIQSTLGSAAFAVFNFPSLHPFIDAVSSLSCGTAVCIQACG